MVEVQENKISAEKIDQVDRVPVINIGVINAGCPPPPPPMPVCSNEPVMARMLRISPTTTIQKQTKDQPKQKKLSLQSTTLQNGNAVEGQTVPNNRKYSTLDRKDPLVRKLAYNAMLDMYGAYHDKANNYVAALPQHQVKKENGLQKIIDNIAAQGGLEKLSGRSNPKAENE
ncbi:hypothetical protein WA026_000516 [Henosepilachna vigintioctopunctata]|uniref:Uncharacterized protein n=1 Tax=Henosepilachna vigintioctopunctata TaxID=420089 RepID=A0AAW1UXW2_9CUCU